jgi:hypothetical protein
MLREATASYDSKPPGTRSCSLGDYVRSASCRKVGRYGWRVGATNGLVSTARLFFVRQLSSLSSAARL